jgi:hypothetical protein
MENGHLHHGPPSFLPNINIFDYSPHSNDKGLVSSMVHFVLHQLKSFHLTPGLVRRSPGSHSLGQGIGSTGLFFELTPFKVFLVTLVNLVHSSLRELSDVVKAELGHGGGFLFATTTTTRTSGGDDAADGALPIALPLRNCIRFSH